MTVTTVWVTQAKGIELSPREGRARAEASTTGAAVARSLTAWQSPLRTQSPGVGSRGGSSLGKHGLGACRCADGFK